MSPTHGGQAQRLLELDDRQSFEVAAGEAMTVAQNEAS
jgi:hypothetical protein